MSNHPDYASEPQRLGPELAERIGMRIETATEHRYFFGPDTEHNEPFEIPVPQERVSIQIDIPPSPVILVEDGSKYPDLQAQVVLRQPSLDGSPEEGWLPLGGMFEAEGSIRDGSLRLFGFDGDLHFVVAPNVIELRREHVFPLVVMLRESGLGDSSPDALA